MASLPVEGHPPGRLTVCARARAAMVESRARRRHRRPRTTLLKMLVAGSAVLPLGLLTAGCSNGSGSKAAATSPGEVTSAAGINAPSPSAVATTTAATGGTAATLALCTTLPAAQVASLSGKALTHSREEDAADINVYTCGYFTASGFGGMSVTVRTMDGAAAYANTLNTDTIEGAAEHVTPLAGFGDKAFSAQDGVHALFGDRLITVAGLTSVPQAEAIIQALQAKLR